MKNYYLFLDDIRYPKDVSWVDIPNKPWIVMRTYNDFVKYVTDKGYAPSFVCYDHDLADSHYQPATSIGQKKIDYSKYKERTGYDAARWLVDFCQDRGIKHPPYVVHSMNPVGKQNIISYVESYNKTCKE